MASRRDPGTAPGDKLVDAGAPDATVVIVTRNRRDELRRALASATAQTGSVEVIVLDDGSIDDTAEMVSEMFPSVRVLRSPESIGYIRQRNRGYEAASAPIVVSIDDDAEFTSPDIVSATARMFDDPRVAAVAMPHVQERRGSEVLHQAPTTDGVWITNAFIGCAHAVRRDVFLELGGFREALEHLFEEPDLSLRLLRSGRVVRLGSTPPVVHHESASRDTHRDLAHICRNHVLLTWLYVPFPDWALRAVQITGYITVSAFRRRMPGAVMRGLIDGARYAISHRRERDPLDRGTYRLYRRLRRAPVRIEEVEAAL